MQALLARKVGITQYFDEQGKVMPVTVLLAGPCTVVQKKTLEKEGYAALQFGFDEIPMKKADKPLKGHFQKAKVPAFRFLHEVAVASREDFSQGQIIKADVFKQGDHVDVTGVSKGKGFQGVVKRWHFKGGAGSHGSMFHRAPGSIGSSSDPSRVFKGLRMAGHMGDQKRTVQNLEVVKVDMEKNLLLVKGSVPGAKQGFVVIQKSIKTRKVPKTVSIQPMMAKQPSKKEKK